MVLFREGGMKIKNVPRNAFPDITNNGGIPQIKSEFNRSKILKSPGSKSPGPGFDCSACGRIYKLKSSLRNHQKWECGKEPQFSCPYCVYKAKQKMHIARHLERMHKCEVNTESILKAQQHAQMENRSDAERMRSEAERMRSESERLFNKVEMNSELTVRKERVRNDIRNEVDRLERKNLLEQSLGLTSDKRAQLDIALETQNEHPLGLTTEKRHDLPLGLTLEKRHELPLGLTMDNRTSLDLSSDKRTALDLPLGLTTDKRIELPLGLTTEKRSQLEQSLGLTSDKSLLLKLVQQDAQ